MKDFLLELYSEELPADEQLLAEEKYLDIFKNGFEINDISYNSIKIFTTPCRIVIIALGLPEFIEKKAEKVKGPKVSLGIDALEGFLKKHNIDKSNICEENIAGQMYWTCDKIGYSRLTCQVLQELVPNLIRAHKWKKAVEIKGIVWPRPLKNLLCLFGNKTLNFQYGSLAANSLTFGNKFLCKKEFINVLSVEDYFEALSKNYILLSRDARKKQVLDQATNLINELNDSLKKDELLDSFKPDAYQNLLHKIVSYFEYPILFLGEINHEYLNDLPHLLIKEVLEKHQRCFALYYQSKVNDSDLAPKKLSPYFFSVVTAKITDSNLAKQLHKNSANARLEDALFLLKQDQKINLELLCEKLKGIIFHEKLGSMHNKCQRLSKWHLKALGNSSRTNFLMIKEDLLNKIIVNFTNVAKYSKCDLATNLVNEFPELRGCMLEHVTNIKEYSFYNLELLKFIKYQYSVECPQEENSTYLLFSLADNLDSLVGLYLAGERMTSGGDKYNMRKYALNVLNIIKNLSYDNKLEFQINHLTDCERGNIAIKNLVKISADLFLDQFNADDKVINDIVEFIKKRHLEYLQIRYNPCIVHAAVNSGICIASGYLPSCAEILLSILVDIINDTHQAIAKTELIEIINVAKRINNILDEGKVNEILKSSIERDKSQQLDLYKSRYFNYLACQRIENEEGIKDTLQFESLWHKLSKYYTEIFFTQKKVTTSSLKIETKTFVEQNFIYIKQLAKDINQFLDVEHIYDKEGKINSIACYKLLISMRAALNYLVDFKHLYSLTPN